MKQGLTPQTRLWKQISIDIAGVCRRSSRVSLCGFELSGPDTVRLQIRSPLVESLVSLVIVRFHHHLCSYLCDSQEKNAENLRKTDESARDRLHSCLYAGLAAHRNANSPSFPSGDWHWDRSLCKLACSRGDRHYAKKPDTCHADGHAKAYPSERGR